MPGFLELPLELRNHVYDVLLHEEVEPKFRGVIIVSDQYVKYHMPLRCYRGLLRVCRQIYREFKQAIQHVAAAKQLKYELDVTFSHGRPYFSLTWRLFPALSPTINNLTINVDLRVREPFREGRPDVTLPTLVPHDHELTHLLEDAPESFADQLFDYIAILLKALASLLLHGDQNFRVLYIEGMTLNMRTPTKLVPGDLTPGGMDMKSRRVYVDAEEAGKLHDAMRNTLQANTKAFQAFNARDRWRLSPLIQIGSLSFATEDRIWGEGKNLILAHDDFQWLRY